MTKKYVLVGIDHGTTNSCIAVMDSDRPRVIQPDPVEVIMPSAVYIDKRGRRFVGQPAIKAMMTTTPEEGNGHTGYKIRIGQDDRYEFSAARKVMTAPELGSIVIGGLLRWYREEMDEDPQACVITVPAKFEHSACEGTREAARRAGLSYYPLLQEPIAAALAYGFTIEDERTNWIVFDLGGGTLDVSLVIVRNGEMIVPEEGNAGDTRLGGRKFDRELMAYVLDELRKKYALAGFTEENKAYAPVWGKLLLAVEAAKIELSKKEQSVVEVDGILCKDERGVPVKVEVPITRTQYEKMIAADVEKAVHCCQMLLTRNRLSPQSVNRLILVGGPTKTPYLQQVLRDRLRIELDHSIDPMTAVALGAALKAATIEIPPELWDSTSIPETPSGQVALTLEYERTSKLPTYCVAGKVEGPAVAEGGLTIEIRRTDGLWSSGQVPVDEYGMFSADVVLIDQNRPTLSQYTTAVLDRQGKTIGSVDEPGIWYPFHDVAPRLANSLLVAVEGNWTEVLVRHGAELPARGSDRFVTTKLIRKGSKEDILRIPVLEAVTHLLGGEDPHADCNVHVGTLKIVGSDQRITCDLPPGAKIDVTLHQDESREIHAVAYVLLLDEEFEVTFKSEAFDLDLDKLDERFEHLKVALEEANRIQGDYPLPAVGEALDVFRRLNTVENVSKELDRAKQGERDACYRAYRGVLELAGAMNQINEMQITTRLQRSLDQLGPVVQDKNADELAVIRQEYQAALSSGNTEDLPKIEARLKSLDLEVRLKPLWELGLDVLSFPPTFRGTSEQIAAYKEAGKLFDEVLTTFQSGGHFTPSQIDRAVRAHERLMRTWPELLEWRQIKQQELEARGQTIFTDVKKDRT